MKAADVNPLEFLAAVDALYRAHGPVMRINLRIFFPEVPDKVLLAKARRLIKRDLIDGCDCGCRGNFTLTDAGREALARGTIPA